MICLNANTTLVIQNIKQKYLTNNTLVLGLVWFNSQTLKIINHIYMYVVRISFGKVLERLHMTKHNQNNLHVNSIHEHPSKSFINKICIIERYDMCTCICMYVKDFNHFKRTEGRNVSFFSCVLLNLDLTFNVLGRKQRKRREQNT